MRRSILAAALAIGLGGLPGAAQAQMGMLSDASDAYSDFCLTSSVIANGAQAVTAGAGAVWGAFTGNRATESTQIMRMITQAQHNICQYRGELARYKQLVYTVNSLSGSRNVRDFASRVGSFSRQIPRAVQAGRGLSGHGSDLLRGANEFFSRDLYADPRNIDGNRHMEFWRKEHQRRRIVTANVKQMAMDGMNDAEAKMESLKHAIDAVNNAKDMRAIAGLQTALQMSEQNLSGHRATIENANLMLAAEDRALQAREKEWLMQNAVEYEEYAIRKMNRR